jgi:hypothetical protein
MAFILSQTRREASAELGGRAVPRPGDRANLISPAAVVVARPRDGTGTECVYVSGPGLRIDRLYATFLAATTPVCNWWIDLDTNSERPEFRHFQGGFHNGCAKFSGVIEPRPGTFGSKPGRVCATLFSDAIVQARSCLSIHT